jgi:long-chain acyl-CoA synthetase
MSIASFFGKRRPQAPQPADSGQSNRAWNIASYLERHAARHADRAAIRFEGRTITFAELNRDACRLAGALRKKGIGAGFRVAVYLPNIPEFLVAYYAIQKLGAVAVSINPMFKSEEVRYLVNDSGAVAIFTTADLAPNVPADCQQLTFRFVAGEEAGADGWRPMSELLAQGSDSFESVGRGLDDPAALLYSSGTTGFPKGVILTQRNIHTNIALCATCSDYRPNDRLACFLPLFHAYGQNYIMNASIMAGSTLVLMQRYVPGEVLTAVGTERITHFFAVPAIFIALLATDLSAYDLSSIRYEMSAAATLPEEISRRWTERFGRRVFEGYGLTECSPFACYNDFHKHRFGSIGRALPGVEVMVVDDADKEVPYGTQGEILIRGDNVMLGYWNKPGETAQTLRGGWLHTGDIGRMDEEGYLYISDRLKDMINVSGFKVWPAEVEGYLYKIEGIRETAVYGLPHPEKGEQVVAAVVLKDGTALTADDIIAYCREHIGAYKVPSRVDIVETLPKSPTGKLLKRVLRERG